MKNIVTPLIYNQKQYNDYGVCAKSGNILSRKFKNWRPLKWKVSGGSKYPQVKLSMGKENKTISVHIAVHETLNPKFPRPPGVSAKDWQKTPKSVKLASRDLYEVNHIDHDTFNFKPGNLEWTTHKQNMQRYQEFRKGSMV